VIFREAFGVALTSSASEKLSQKFGHDSRKQVTIFPAKNASGLKMKRELMAATRP
jgi:hypothetical protein